MIIDVINQTPETLIAAAYAGLQALTDDGRQMHRRAVQGRRLVVHVHGWDAWANNGDGGRSIDLRVEGQYLDRGRAYFRTTADAEAFAAECRRLLAAMPPAVAGDVYTPPRCIRQAK